MRRIVKQSRSRFWRWRMGRQSVRYFGVKNLLKDVSNKSYLDEIRSYWKKQYGRSVHPGWHMAYKKTTGLQDVRYIPNHEWFSEILPFLNDLSLRAAFRDKNLSDVFLNTERTPETIFKRMHGHYYAPNNTPISFDTAERRLLACRNDMIIKPSQTDDGYGIRLLVNRGSELFLNNCPCLLSDLEKQYGRNFLVQKKIIQHPLMSKVHPESVNTIRMVTFRWKSEIRILLAFARFGNHGNLTDNAGTGGVCCGIDEQGKLNDSVIDEVGNIYSEHPMTGYPFAKTISIPNYDSICKLSLDLHRQIFNFDIVSWDIAIGNEGEPIFLEVNFRGVVNVYQFACRQPLFGDLTEEVLEAVRDNR